MTRGIIILFALAALVSAIFVGFYYFNLPPKAEALINGFEEHRTSYERLRDMLQADEQIRRLADWGIETVNSPIAIRPPKGDFPLDRYNEYINLLKKINGLGLSRTQGEHPDFYILVWASGWAGDTVHISICWLSREPDNRVRSPGDFDKASLDGKHGFIYKHIDENWYLMKDW